MTKRPILLLGAGGHARSCIDVIEQESRFSVVGLVGLYDEVGTHILGYPVIGTDEDLPSLLKVYNHVLVSIGQIKTSELRMRLFNLLMQNNCKLPVIVSPHSFVSPHATLGLGTIVMHGAVVNANAVVGQNCIINSKALVEHDVVIADHCHIATMAVINSGVYIGSGTFVGSNSSVRQSVNIGERCLIGMGQRVLADCEGGTHMPSLKALP